MSSANHFRRMKDKEDRERRLARGDWACPKCSGCGITIWHMKDQQCPREGK